MPRILGYAFNPLSVYFCHRRDGALAAMVYEVHNTFGERHSYVIEATPAADRGHPPASARSASCLALHGHGHALRFPRRRSRARRIVDRHLGIGCRPARSCMLPCRVSAGRLMTTPAAARCFSRIRSSRLKVIGAIHWEALRLWVKGLRLHPHPAPAPAVTAVRVVKTRHRTSQEFACLIHCDRSRPAIAPNNACSTPAARGSC